MELDLHKIGIYHRCMIVMGLIPGSIKKQQQRIQKAYNIFLLLSLLGVSTYGVHDVHKSEDLQNDLLISLSIVTLCFIVDLTTLLVILLEVIVTYDKHVDFINKSRQIYTKINDKTGYKMSTGALSSSLKCKYACICALLFIGIIVYLLVSSFNYKYGFFRYSILILLIIRARFMQVSLNADILQNFLQVLNEQLQQIVPVKWNKPLMMTHIDSSAMESLQRLRILKEIYSDISQCVKLYNEIFGWSITNVVICCYIGIVVHLHWCFMALDGFYHRQFLLVSMTKLIPLTTMIFVFGYNCEELTRSCYKTASLVKQLLATTNMECRTVAYEFLLQLYSRPLQVTAKGFFQVNLGMLMGMLTYIASLMVILVQFSLAELQTVGIEAKKYK